MISASKSCSDNDDTTLDVDDSTLIDDVTLIDDSTLIDDVILIDDSTLIAEHQYKHRYP